MERVISLNGCADLCQEPMNRKPSDLLGECDLYHYLVRMFSKRISKLAPKLTKERYDECLELAKQNLCDVYQNIINQTE